MIQQAERTRRWTTTRTLGWLSADALTTRIRGIVERHLNIQASRLSVQDLKTMGLSSKHPSLQSSSFPLFDHLLTFDDSALSLLFEIELMLRVSPHSIADSIQAHVQSQGVHESSMLRPSPTRKPPP